MSLQRIFESARKLGVPVIVTDPAGREPMVIVPLEQFEAIAGGSEPRAPSPQSPTPNPDTSIGIPTSRRDRQTPTAKPLPPVDIETFAEIAPKNDEISLDERFYFEPVDEGQGG